MTDSVNDESWAEHMRSEFVTMDVEQALQTMTAEPCVNHVPTMTGGFGAAAVRQFYRDHFSGCNDCHTPGYFLGKPNSSRFLGGSDVGFDLPGTGTFVGPNLTPDNETGLGTWSRDEIITAIQTGVRPDGRILAPIMPWRAFAGLTKSDAGAIADYLKSLPPVSHKAQGPFGPGDKPPVPRMMVVFPAGNRLAQSRATARNLRDRHSNNDIRHPRCRPG